MNRLGGRGEGLEDIGYARGRVGRERRSYKTGRGNKKKGSGSARPASTQNPKSELRNPKPHV